VRRSGDSSPHIPLSETGRDRDRSRQYSRARSDATDNYSPFGVHWASCRRGIAPSLHMAVRIARADRGKSPPCTHDRICVGNSHNQWAEEKGLRRSGDDSNPCIPLSETGRDRDTSRQYSRARSDASAGDSPFGIRRGIAPSPRMAVRIARADRGKSPQCTPSRICVGNSHSLWTEREREYHRRRGDSNPRISLIGPPWDRDRSEQYSRARIFVAHSRNRWAEERGFRRGGDANPCIP